MFIAEDLKTVTPEAIETAIAIAMMELLGGKVVCRVSTIDFSPGGSGFGVDLDIHLERPLSLGGEEEDSP
jgi:hypothetical protein